ncbi:hypothetical protein AYO44_00280 [Planctomycetaceae bacterium SCGC AG-212-F19]|nr:hypothetical protein AYO44_00280 [Planctomycetaceae bacterium SCGC AG-212-F19]
MREKIVRALVYEIGPALAMDGAAIEVLDVSDGVVKVRLGGVCGGCPSSIMVAITGIEQELRRLVPGVESLEALP